MSNATLPNKIDNYRRFDGGIAPYDKEAEGDQYAFGRSIDYRSHPKELKILPKTVKESGSVYENLPVDGDRVNDTVYLYDKAGNIYTRSLAGSHAKTRAVANSHGNGMKYFSEDDFLYYTSDKLIGRYGQINGTPSYVDDFLGSEGGVPLNTHALDLEASSSQYASRADTASLSITGDLSLEAYIKPESLPAVGSSMVLASKWDINTNLRSYKFEIYAVSGYFGDGSDGTLTISSDTTEAPIDAPCTGTGAAYTLSATNVSFATGQVIYIHQSQGTGAGTNQRNKVVSYSTGTITLETELNATYTTGAQVRVLKQHTTVTVNSGITYTAKHWDRASGVGGILAFLASTSVTVSGTLNVNGTTATGNTGAVTVGFIGGSVAGAGDTGEGTTGASVVNQNTANGNGGGGGTSSSGAGGGGGNGTAGNNGSGSTGGIGGNATSTTDLTTMTFGGGGGAAWENSATSGGGGAGAGIIFVTGTAITVTGAITANGGGGRAGQVAGDPGGGAGAGGSIRLTAKTATLEINLITANGGTGGAGNGAGGTGGNGGSGRVHLDYYTSYTGTTTPTINAVQDNNLVTTTTYQLRLGVSSTGTNEEFLSKNSTITTGVQYHVAISWDASTSTATFCQNGVSLGTSTGTLTSISNNASVFGIGADFNSTARNFYDGLIDEVRVWNTERTVAQFLANKDLEIATNSAGLAAYYQLDNNYDDSTSNANNLTASGSPSFTTSVPFSSPTTRLDIDQSLSTSGSTYALPTVISETAANRQTFVPAKDPQKSIQVLIAAKGTGNWTITVHDAVNRVLATLTVTNANVSTGDYEFTFTTPWRPVRGAGYHFHLTSTVADGTVTTTSLNDLETVDFTSYYQFLVTDEQFHPIEQMINLIAIGNEHYVATYDATEYNPHRIVLPSGWKVRCMTKWREYLVIGCWKGDSVDDYGEGMLFFWDGYSTTYNFHVSVPEGSVNALFAARGILYVWAGYQGDMVGYVGGESAEKIRQLPKVAIGKSVETLPKAVNMWQGLLRWGVAGESDSTEVERGIYTYGQKDKEQPNSFSYDYPISTGSRTATNIQIGFIFPVNRKLLVGWRDNVSYGVDVIDPAGTPYATGTIERDIKDYGGVYKEKDALTVRADFKPLVSGDSIKLKYKLDRASAWTEGEAVTTAAETVARLPIIAGNHREIQIAADMGAAVVLLELTLEENMKATEQVV